MRTHVGVHVADTPSVRDGLQTRMESKAPISGRSSAEGAQAIFAVNHFGGPKLYKNVAAMAMTAPKTNLTRRPGEALRRHAHDTAHNTMLCVGRGRPVIGRLVGHVGEAVCRAVGRSLWRSGGCGRSVISHFEAASPS